MTRKMATDRSRLDRRLAQLITRRGADGSGALEPMWLMIFPEGTNLSENGRAKSAAWADKQGVEDFKHLLIPRSGGMYVCAKALKGGVEWVYDCTLAYDGIP